jgi:ubiquinone/menaquinone biosynthesis C-methylase UbiE
MSDLKEIYQKRFGHDIEFRDKMYKILCSHFFQKYVPPDSVVLDIAAGYCEFINNISAGKKIAIDINPDIKQLARNDVEIIMSPSTEVKDIGDESIDVVFTSNFFEHLTRKDIVKTIREVNRMLRPGGKFLILQPNYKYCYRDYWMFFDHITALDHRSLSEVLIVNGFDIMECKPRFLPYTTKSRYLKKLFLVKLYLKIPFAQLVFGKQAFIYARKL